MATSLGSALLLAAVRWIRDGEQRVQRNDPNEGDELWESDERSRARVSEMHIENRNVEELIDARNVNEQIKEITDDADGDDGGLGYDGFQYTKAPVGGDDGARYAGHMRKRSMARVVSRRARDCAHQIVRAALSAGHGTIHRLNNETWALGPRLVPAFAEIVRDGAPVEQVVAACYIMHIHWRSSKHVLNKEYEEAVEILKKTLSETSSHARELHLTAWCMLGMFRCPSSLWPDAEKLARCPDEAVRVFAASAALAGGSQQVGHVRIVREGLGSENVGLALAAANALLGAKVWQQEAMRRVAEMLSGNDTQAQYAAMSVLRQCGGAAHGVARRVIGYMSDRSRPVEHRAYAAEVLGAIAGGSEAASEALLALLDSKVPMIIRGAISALTENGAPSSKAVARIAQCLSGDIPEEVRIAAAHGLAELGGSAAAAVPALLICGEQSTSEDVKAAVGAALAGIGAGAIVPLVERAAHAGLPLYPVLVHAFARMGMAEARALLRCAMESDTTSVVEILLGGMSVIGWKAAFLIPELSELLTCCEDEAVACQIIGLIRQAGPSAIEAAPALIRCVCRGSDELAWIAGKALEDLGPAVLPHIERAVSEETDPASKTRLSNVQCGTTKAAPALMAPLSRIRWVSSSGTFGASLSSGWCCEGRTARSAIERWRV
jgi:HEAT repeat protein